MNEHDEDDEDPITPPGVANAPESIYLVVGDLPETSDFAQLAEVTWCDHIQGPHDVEYVRADLVDKMKDKQ